MGITEMDHSEAVEQMATERYLLDELSPEQRDAFEEHVFDCPECALDLRAGAMFVDEAKVQLPQLTKTAGQTGPNAIEGNGKKQDWFGWLWPLFRPALAGPVFAALLLVVGYQNLVVFPGLRSAADGPRIVPLISLRGQTRGEAMVIDASHKLGVGLLVPLPTEPAYTAWEFAFADAQGKTAWSRELPPVAGSTLSLVIPGAGLQAGTYTLVVSGKTANGQLVEVERSKLDIHFHD